MSEGRDDEPASSLYSGLAEDLGDASLAQRAIDSLRKRFGGQRVYIRSPDRETRNAAIRERWNGRNRDEICQEFGVSERALRRILNDDK